MRGSKPGFFAYKLSEDYSIINSIEIIPNWLKFMTVSSVFIVPDDISFEDAIALTQSLLPQMMEGNLSESQIEERIAALVKTQNGARGFFVTYLTHEETLADHPSEGVLKGLKSAPEIISELLVKNLVMSSAMVISHTRKNALEMAEGSQRVRSRSLNLIKSLQLSSINSRVEQMRQSLTTKEGNYQEFLQKWGYDEEQKQAMLQTLELL